VLSACCCAVLCCAVLCCAVLCCAVAAGVQIELDLPRTFPRHAWLSGPEGQEALRAVLTAYAGHNPDVGYCQVGGGAGAEGRGGAEGERKGGGGRLRGEREGGRGGDVSCGC
jgi:hypothetical protein